MDSFFHSVGSPWDPSTLLSARKVIFDVDEIMPPTRVPPRSSPSGDFLLFVHPQRRPCVLCLETESVTPNTQNLPKQAATTLSGGAQYSIMVHKSELREFGHGALSFSDPKLQEGKKISSSCYSLPAAKTLVLFLTEGLHCLFKGLAGDYSASPKRFLSMHSRGGHFAHWTPSLP